MNRELATLKTAKAQSNRCPLRGTHHQTNPSPYVSQTEGGLALVNGYRWERIWGGMEGTKADWGETSMGKYSEKGNKGVG